MIRHIVCWNFKEDLSVQEKEAAGKIIKKSLEDLKNTVPGVLDIRVIVNELESSNRDICLFSELESQEALRAYQIHPEHVKAGAYVKSVTSDRSCFDFED